MIHTSHSSIIKFQELSPLEQNYRSGSEHLACNKDPNAGIYKRNEIKVMVNIERLTSNGWKQRIDLPDLPAAIEEARKLCIECPSTYRILRNQDLICIVRQNGIIWINASPEIMGLNKQEETAAV